MARRRDATAASGPLELSYVDRLELASLLERGDSHAIARLLIRQHHRDWGMFGYYLKAQGRLAADDIERLQSLL